MSTVKLPIEKIYLIKEVFDAFDTDFDGLNSYSDLWCAVMSLGYLITEKQAKAIIQQNDTEKSGKFNVTTFYSILAKLNNVKNTTDTITRNAFYSLGESNLEDGERQTTVPTSTFIQLMTSVGEPLSVAMISDLMKNISLEPNGEINLEKLEALIMEDELTLKDGKNTS